MNVTNVKVLQTREINCNHIMEVRCFEHKVSSCKINFSLFRMDFKVLANVKSLEFLFIKYNFSFILIPNKQFRHSVLVS